MRKAEAKVRAGNLHISMLYFQSKPCAIALIPLVLLAPKFGPDVYGIGGILLDVFNLRSIAGLGVGLLVRVADGEDVVQLVVSGDVEAVEEELAFLV